MAATSRFEYPVRFASGYDYWASTDHVRRLDRRSARLGSDVLAPPGEPPSYYTLGWQILLWTAFTALLLVMMFG